MRYLIMPLLAAAASVLSTGAAHADLGDQLFKLLPDDGATYDYFGTSVTIGGSTAIVGVPRDDDNGSGSGSVYLFDTTTGRQLAKLLPDDGAAGDKFGNSVAISGATAIVGAHGDDDNGNYSGSAYLVDICDPANPTQIFKLLPDDGAAGDTFGSCVAISGAIAIVGAHTDDDNGKSTGSAYLFDTTTGQQLFKLLANNGAAGDGFGTSVAISGATAIVGAHRFKSFDPGSAYLFDISDPSNPTQLFELLADDGAAGDEFGSSVAISGTTAIVGAYFDNDNGSWSGSAYLFDITTGLQIDKLLPDDGAAGDRFGRRVAISGSTAIVSASRHDDNGSGSGSAYLFDTTTGRQIAKLLPDDGAALDVFGSSVAISGATAIVGAVLDDDNGIDSGSVYLFDAAAPGMCPWDLDDNRIVGASDLLILLANWGNPYGASDLLELLANWGPCG